MIKSDSTTEDTDAGTTATMEPPVKDKKPKKPKPEADASDKPTYKIGEEYLIDPQVIMVDHEANSRNGLHTPEDIAATAKSMKKYGQLQPVLTTLTEVDGKVEVDLVGGYKRYSAAMLHNKENPDDQMKLRCFMIKADSDLAKLLLDIESNRTTAVTPVDDWKAHNRLRDAGKTNAWIAKHYGVDPSYVSHLQKLDDVSDEMRARIKDGQCSLKMARDLCKYKLAEQEDIIKIGLAIAEKNWKADKETVKKDFNGKLTTGAVGEAIRRYIDKGTEAGSETDEGDDAGTEAGSETAPKEKKDKKPVAAPAMTLKDVKNFFKEHFSDLTGESEEPMRRLGDIMTALFNGVPQKTVIARLVALVNGEDDPVPVAKEKKKSKAK